MIGHGPIPAIPLTQQNASLRIRSGTSAGKTFRLSKIRMVVGRNNPPMMTVDIDLAGCELDSQPTVSRRHAEIQWADSLLQVIDLQSANGTFVDGARVRSDIPGNPSDPVNLRTGSVLIFGNVELEVVCDGM